MAKVGCQCGLRYSGLTSVACVKRKKRASGGSDTHSGLQHRGVLPSMWNASRRSCVLFALLLALACPLTHAAPKPAGDPNYNSEDSRYSQQGHGRGDPGYYDSRAAGSHGYQGGYPDSRDPGYAHGDPTRRDAQGGGYQGAGYQDRGYQAPPASQRERTAEQEGEIYKHSQVAGSVSSLFIIDLCLLLLG